MNNKTTWTARSGHKIEITTIPGSLNVLVKVNGEDKGESYLETKHITGNYKKAGCVAKAGQIGIFKKELENIMKTYSPKKYENEDLVYSSAGNGGGAWMTKLERAELEGF